MKSVAEKERVTCECGAEFNSHHSWWHRKHSKEHAAWRELAGDFTSYPSTSPSLSPAEKQKKRLERAIAFRKKAEGQDKQAMLKMHAEVRDQVIADNVLPPPI